MALPTIDLTWDYTKINQAIAATGVANNTYKAVLLAEKNGMKNFTANAWTVVSSSNAVVANGSDNWTTVADIVNNTAGVAHSWIVLKQAQMGAGNLQLCIDMSSNVSTSRRAMYLSANAGFSGGTTTARPTATDEVTLFTSGTIFGLSVDAAVKLQQWASSDGKQYRMTWLSGNAVQNAIIIGTPKLPTSGWTNSYYAIATAGATALDFAVLCAAAAAPFTSRINGANTLMWMTSENWGTTTVGAPARLSTSNPLDSNSFPLFPIGLACEVGGAEGRQGLVYDMWWGLTINGNGDTYPNDATRQFVQIGDVVFPNNGTAILTT